MINNLEVDNLKQIYLKLLEDIDIIDSQLYSVELNIEDVSSFLNSNCKVNDISIDKGQIQVSKNDINNVHNYLNDVIKPEISDLIIQINESINN